jgi:cell shape-determining protein MreC
MSNSIVILKQIIDLLYEDHMRTVTDHSETKVSLTETEMQLKQKEKEVETLFTENIKLSNLLSKYESDIELLANIISENPKKTPEPKVQQTPEKESPKVCGRTVIIEQTKETPVETPKENTVEESAANKKKPRTDYMREYQREYRKKKREEKISMNV